jgi:mono/diheme cytochrome c family protein
VATRFSTRNQEDCRKVVLTPQGGSGTAAIRTGLIAYQRPEIKPKLPQARVTPSGHGKLRRLWHGGGMPVIVTLAALATAGAAAALAVIHGGFYNVSATEQHTAPVYWALEFTMRNAVKRSARDVTAPGLSDPALIQRGLALHRGACLQCHGAPGVSPDDVGKALMPAPNNLVQTAREWSAAEIYWTTKHGLKMTGMPAWGMRFADEDLWAIVAFVKHLPRLSAAEYEAMARAARSPSSVAGRPSSPDARAGDPARGVAAMQQYACTTCHTIPGMVGAAAHVGPPLTGIGDRKFLGGRLPNSPENLVRWIRHPREVSPQSLMPDLGVTEQHARDMAAYLLTLKGRH